MSFPGSYCLWPVCLAIYSLCFEVDMSLKGFLCPSPPTHQFPPPQCFLFTFSTRLPSFSFCSVPTSSATYVHRSDLPSAASVHSDGLSKAAAVPLPDQSLEAHCETQVWQVCVFFRLQLLLPTVCLLSCLDTRQLWIFQRTTGIKLGSH